MQHDIELAERVKKRNTPIRDKTAEELHFLQKRKKDSEEALSRHILAQKPFKDPETKQGDLTPIFS